MLACGSITRSSRLEICDDTDIGLFFMALMYCSSQNFNSCWETDDSHKAEQSYESYVRESFCEHCITSTQIKLPLYLLLKQKLSVKVFILKKQNIITWTQNQTTSHCPAGQPRPDEQFPVLYAKRTFLDKNKK